jgi:hypothetical protein
MAVAAVADFIHIGVQRTGGHFVEQRFPDMRAASFNEDDVVLLSTIASAQFGCEFQSCRAPAHDNDLRLLRCHGQFLHALFETRGSPANMHVIMTPVAA